jgi:hypothetical protein
MRVATVLLCLAVQLSAQTTSWTVGPVPYRFWTGMVAYDPLRDRTVMVDLPGRLFELRGDRWRVLDDRSGPTPRALGRMCWDTGRDRLVVFGGAQNTSGAPYLNDTWEWDPSGWKQRATPVAPPARWFHTLCYDERRGKVVMFGGSTIGTTIVNYGDTWEWDGTAWTQRLPATSPPPNWGASSCYDSRRGVTQVFGGTVGGVLKSNALWEWDGTSWTQVQFSGPAPSGRSSAAVGYAPSFGATLVFGGYESPNVVGDLWAWDGVRWTKLEPGGGPLPQNDAGFFWSAPTNRMLLCGGETVNRPAVPQAHEVWGLSLAGWTQVCRGSKPPLTDQGATAATDGNNGGVLVFGGSTSLSGSEHNETSLWDGLGWRLLDLAVRPQARTWAAAAWDSARRRVVLFGGSGNGTFLADTWEWDGVAWLQRQPANQPPPLQRAALAYDPVRARSVLVGSTTPGTGLMQVWEWDGQNWSQNLATGAPVADRGHALAFDPVQRRLLLVGGTLATAWGLHWEFDGTTWQQRAAPFVGRRERAALVTDPTRERVVLTGGYGPSQLFDTLEWDGASWTVVSNVFWAVAMASDPVRGNLVGVGAFKATVVPTHDVTAIYRPLLPAEALPYGAGCAGGSGVPALTASTWPYLGGTLRLEADRLVPGQPAFCALGASDQAYAGLQLPFDLVAIGMPGCWLWASIDALLPFPGATATRTLALPVPASQALLGGRFYLQAAAVDPAANPLGLVVSAGLRARIGMK